MKIDINIKGNSFKLYINDVLHIFIADRITSIQSYIIEDKWYFIDYTTDKSTISSNYDSKEKWLSVITELNKVI